MLAKEIMPITIFEDRITNIDFDKLLDQMREEALDPGNVGNSKWEGGVIGSFSRNSKILEHSGVFNEIIKRIDSIRSTHFEYTRYSKMNYDYEVWWNYYTEGKFQEFHTHNVNVLSGIIYLTDSDAGTAFCERGDRHIVYPKKGKIVIFPSWLGHYVQPSKAGEERATIAFNFNFHR
jgi:hypothetical protein